jgi:tRNA uridine 5-carboxymethylaminomethyl modification enzyme
MFTSRAEYRTLLRQDNADIRLTPLGFKIGLASKERLEKVNSKIQKTEKLIKFLKQTSVTQDQINPILTRKQLSLIHQSVKLYKIASRPQLSLTDFEGLDALQSFFHEERIDKTILEQVEIHLKYSGYIDKERSNADKLNKLENVIIPQTFNYSKVNSLSHEAKEKLSKIQPTTISQASRISGVSPSDISVLLVYMGR